MKYPKLRELVEAIKALIVGPYTTKFPAKPSPADPNFRGKPVYNEEDCMGCGACFKVCPARAIELIEPDIKAGERPFRKLRLRWDYCIFCGQCEANCPTKTGVKLGQEYDLAAYDRKESRSEVEKELVFCPNCQTIIAPRDQIRWLVREKMGAFAYTKPEFLLSLYRELGLIKEESPPPGEELLRSDRLLLLCPTCRRIVDTEEHWGQGNRIK